MRQLGELTKNGADEFQELGVEVVAVFREEKEGLAGLEKVKAKTKAPFTLALDTPATATAGYSNGRKEFDNYIIDNKGVIRGIIDGSLKSRARSSKLLEIVKSVESDSASMAGSNAASPEGDQAAVQQVVMNYVKAVNQSNGDLMKQVLHEDVKLIGLSGTPSKKMVEAGFSKIVDFAANKSVPDKMIEGSKVEVLDVTGDLASTKMTASGAVAMVQLAKENGTWKIVQILSQANAK